MRRVAVCSDGRVGRIRLTRFTSGRPWRHSGKATVARERFGYSGGTVLFADLPRPRSRFPLRSTLSSVSEDTHGLVATFPKLLSLVEASAFLHEGQREKSGGIVVASCDDYEIAKGLIRVSYSCRPRSRVNELLFGGARSGRSRIVTTSRT